jgi:hypothetical protein
VGIHQRRGPDRLIGEAELEVCRDGQVLATLRPAQHFHLHGQQWTTEVAIHSSWSGDVYTILHNSDAQGSVRLTFVHNPLMRWLWLGGCLMGLGAAIRLWPARRVPLAIAIPIPLGRQQPGSRRRTVAAASYVADDLFPRADGGLFDGRVLQSSRGECRASASCQVQRMTDRDMAICVRDCARNLAASSCCAGSICRLRW